MTARTLLTLRITDLDVAIDVTAVREVVRGLPVTPVPHAPAGLSGLANLRGELLTVLDLGAHLGLARSDTAGRELVVLAQGASAALETDGVREVVAVDAEIVAVPQNVPAVVRQLLAGVYPLPGGLLHVLDTAALTRVAVTPSATSLTLQELSS